jgi:putative spermidine/putrescine transport system permease protein
VDGHRLTLVFFLIPLYGMLEFTTRDLINGGRTGKFWTTLVDVPQVTERYPALAEGFASSMALALFTVVVMLLLLVPTMTWVRLRLPGLTRTVEFICLLPLTVPAIVLVVGLTPVYAWVTYLLGEATALAGAGVRHPGPALRLPVAGRRAARDRRQDPVGGGPVTRRVVAAR